MAGSLFSTLFRLKDASKLLEHFRCPEFNILQEQPNDYIHCDLAPSFGELDKESMKLVDENMKITIAGTMRALRAARYSKRRNGPLRWDEVIAAMAQCPILEQEQNSVYKSGSLDQESSSWFHGSDGTPREDVVDQVKNWFTELVSDEDVLQNTRIPISELADMVARTGVQVTSLSAAFYKIEQRSRKVIDIGVLRFPDIKRPYFQVYRIQITVWAKCKRITMYQKDGNGITGVYQARVFRPRADIIDQLTKEARIKALSEANGLFD